MNTATAQFDRHADAAAALERMASGAPVGLEEKGGIADVVEHFRRAGKLDDGGTDLSRGPDHPYASIEAVYACTKFIASAVSCMPLMVSTERQDVIESGPIAELLDAPNPHQAIEEMIFELVGWVLLSGRAYIVKTLSGGRIIAMESVGGPQIRPAFAGQRNALTPARNQTRDNHIGWWFRPDGVKWQDAEPLKLAEAHELKAQSFQPDKPFEGLPVADVVRRKINQVYKADRANELSLDNNVKFAGIISPDEPVSREQWDDFVETVREQYSGYQHRNRPLMTSRKVSVENTQATFKEMEFTTLLDRSVNAICAAFGLDPSVVGYTPTGGRQDFVGKVQQAAWISVVLPTAGWVAGHIERGVFNTFEADASLSMSRARRADRCRPMHAAQTASVGWRRGLRRRATARQSGRLIVWFDDSGVPAVRQARLELAKEGAILIEAYKATPQDVIETFDLGLPINDAQRTPWQKIGEMPVDLTDAAGQQPPAEGPPEDAPPDENPEDGGGEMPEAPDPEDADATAGRSASGRSGGGDSGGWIVKRLSERQLERMQESWFRSWQPVAEQLRKKVTRHYGRIRREMLDNLQRLDPARSFPGGRRKDFIGEILFDLAESRARLRADVAPIIREALDLGLDQIRQQRADAEDVPLEQIPEADTQAPDFQAALRKREIRIADVSDRIARDMRNALAEAAGEGASNSQLADLVRERFGVESNQAKRIAQTEIGAAVEEANHIGRQQNNVPMKSWLSSRKQQNRENHLRAEQQTMREPIPTDEPFVVPQGLNSPGGRAMHPRASTLPAADVINCACTVISRFPDDRVRDMRLIAGLVERGFLNHARSNRDKRKEST